MDKFWQPVVGLRLTLPIIVCVWALSVVVTGQDPQSPGPTASPEVRVEDDPTKPILFSIRNEYRNLKNGAWANTVLFRVDKLSFKSFRNKGSANGLIFRLDVPLSTGNRQGSTRTGLGDIYGQVLYVPVARRRFALATGAGLVIPTATDTFTGQGKLIIAPTVIPVWYFAKRKRLGLIRFQNLTSVAGNGNRPDVNYLIADPTAVRAINRKWWVALNNEFKWDWRTKLGSGIAGVQIGRLVRGKFGFWVKPEFPWGGGRQGNLSLKFTVYSLR